MIDINTCAINVIIFRYISFVWCKFTFLSKVFNRLTAYPHTSPLPLLNFVVSPVVKQAGTTDLRFKNEYH
jgi:hypothetical protein